MPAALNAASDDPALVSENITKEESCARESVKQKKDRVVRLLYLRVASKEKQYTVDAGSTVDLGCQIGPN